MNHIQFADLWNRKDSIRKKMKEGRLRIEGQIERVNGKQLSYRDFAATFLAKNQPVVLTGLMDGWKACTDWVTDDSQPNLPFFSAHFGNSIVQVAECGTREFSDQKRLEMTVAEFIDKWAEHSANNIQSGSVGDCTNDDASLLYLKDWHLVKEYPEYFPYTTPLFFNDDWLNLYLDSFLMHKDPENNQEKTEICCSDYRFVYMGPKGTWTPLHADVFRSYSWSANVCGQKKWLFLSPSQSHLIFDRNMKASVYNIFEEVDEKKFPGFKKAIWLECIQGKDEIIFVPSGWFHQVHNLEDTISINHNWFNAYNLSWVWDLLLRDYNEAREYIEDIRDICDDFEGLCQRNLAINTGMNFYDIFVLIARFTYASVVLLCFLLRDDGHPTHGLNPVIRNLYLNLTSTRHIAVRMGSEETEECGLELDFMKCFEDPKFRQLCMSMGRTYGVIHQQKLVSYDIKDLFTENLKALAMEVPASQVHTPEDLIKFMDYVVANLGVAMYCEEKACEAYSV